MKKLSTLVAFTLLLCGLAVAQDRRDNREWHPNEKIVKGPDIEELGPTWAQVRWSTDTGGSSVVRYGTDPNHLDRKAEAPYQTDQGRPGETHRVRLEHLRPETTYYYMVYSGQGEGTGTSARSPIEQFTTRR
jgi:hypothetical protein